MRCCRAWVYHDDALISPVAMDAGNLWCLIIDIVLTMLLMRCSWVLFFWTVEAAFAEAPLRNRAGLYSYWNRLPFPWDHSKNDILQSLQMPTISFDWLPFMMLTGWTMIIGMLRLVKEARHSRRVGAGTLKPFCRYFNIAQATECPLWIIEIQLINSWGLRAAPSSIPGWEYDKQLQPTLIHDMISANWTRVDRTTLGLFRAQRMKNQQQLSIVARYRHATQCGWSFKHQSFANGIRLTECEALKCVPPAVAQASALRCKQTVAVSEQIKRHWRRV